MSWKRIATFVVGGALCAAGTLIPTTGAVLLPAGVGLLGWATRWPEDQKRPPRPRGVQQKETPREP